LIQSVNYGQRLWFANDWIREELYGQYFQLDKLGLLYWQVLIAKKKTQQFINPITLWRQVVLKKEIVKQLKK